jgi:hypothetical protein
MVVVEYAEKKEEEEQDFQREVTSRWVQRVGICGNNASGCITWSLGPRVSDVRCTCIG